MKDMRKFRDHVALAGGARAPVGSTIRRSLGAGLLSLDLFPSVGDIRRHVDPRGLAGDWMRVGGDMKAVMSKVDKLVKESEAARERLIQAQAATKAGGIVVDGSAEVPDIYREMRGVVEKATRHGVSPEISEAMATFERAVAKSNGEMEIMYPHATEDLGEALETLEVGECERRPS
jgi:hypothetical protein